jgi:TonB family protein
VDASFIAEVHWSSGLNFRIAPCNLGNAFRVYFSIDSVFSRRALLVLFAIAIAAFPLALASPVDDEPVLDIGPGITPPRVTHQVTPANNPDDGRGFRISGTVVVGLVVSSQGEPKNVHVVKSLDKDIDQSAVDAVKQWHFDPAKKGTQPVAVRITVEIRFHSM